MPHGIRQPPPPIRRRTHSGRRIRKTVSTWNSSAYIVSSDTRFLYDGWNLVAEFASSTSTSTLNLLRSYVWGLDLSGSAQGAGGVGGLLCIDLKLPTSTSSAGTFFPVYDGNGNILSAIDASNGTVAATYEYGPFGEPLRASGPAAANIPFRFSTKYTDPETGLLYYGYRYYSPSLRRWLTRDPIEEQGGLNLYGMVANNPVNFWDYLGLVDASRCAQLMEKYKAILPRAGEQSFKGDNAFRDANLNGLLAMAAHDQDSDYQSSLFEWTYWVVPATDGGYLRKDLYTSKLYNKVHVTDVEYYAKDVLPVISGKKVSPNVGNGHIHPRWHYVNGALEDTGPRGESFSAGISGDIGFADAFGPTIFLLTPSGRVRVYSPKEGETTHSRDYLRELGKEYEKDFPALVECIRCSGLLK
jgi:RHS repeat-associated protein